MLAQNGLHVTEQAFARCMYELLVNRLAAADGRHEHIYVACETGMTPCSVRTFGRRAERMELLEVIWLRDTT
jgi:hypothetical protein